VTRASEAAAPSLRICFFNRSYYPDLTATGQLLTELAEDLAREGGHAVWVVAGPPLSPAADHPARAPGWALFEREERNGVRILRARGTTFRPRRFAGRAVNYLSYFASACVAGLRVPRPHVVVALTDPPIIGLAALLAARRAGARFVFLCQDVFPEVAGLLEDFHSASVNGLLDRVSRSLIRKADRVVAVGETMRERLIAGKGADPRKVIVIHNWADCSAIRPRPRRTPFALAHGLAEAFVVMHSGNVGLSQDLDTLLDAAERLRAYPDIVVVVVGDGAKRESLEEQARSRGLTNVRFIPYQPKAKLGDSFASADVFVVSLKAGLAGYIVPSKLYGILAAGRPYVAAVEEASEVRAITRKYGCGLLAEPGDGEDVARKILALYHDRVLAGELGARAREAALHFDRPAQVRAYERLFRDLAGAGARIGESRAPLLKRPFDIFLAGLGLLGSTPLWAVVALAIKLEDGGPVFYGQERVGKGGRRFWSWKFRSMVVDADSRFGPLQAAERDPRVTRVGRILRATAMDELPQLWNIFKGEMSFVGPRALLPEEIEVGAGGEPVRLETIPGHDERHRVTPGLTGIAQVFAPRDIPRRHKFRLDLLYVRKQSFGLDLKLILLSFWITLRGKWEHRGRKV
jgi:lipopolysaccharide/colanic/teichoic acid biosynthesis glycosyltransferase